MGKIQTKLKNNGGITLIALVVTIIILLILAGVAINMALGDNGLFKRSREAVNTWKEAEGQEKSELDKALEEINNEMEGDKAVIKDFKKYVLITRDVINFDGTLNMEVILDEVYQYIEEKEKQELKGISDEELILCYYNSNNYIGLPDIGKVASFEEYTQKLGEEIIKFAEEPTVYGFYNIIMGEPEEYKKRMNTIKEEYLSEVGEIGEKSDEELFVWQYNKNKSEEKQVADFKEFIYGTMPRSTLIEMGEETKKFKTVYELLEAMKHITKEEYDTKINNIKEKKIGKVREIIMPNGENIERDENDNLSDWFICEDIPYKEGTYNFIINTYIKSYTLPVNIEEYAAIKWVGYQSELEESLISREAPENVSVVDFSNRKLLEIDSIKIKNTDNSWTEFEMIDDAENQYLEVEGKKKLLAIGKWNLEEDRYYLFTCNNKDVIFYNL